METQIQPIINQFAQIIEYVVPLAITLGLTQWLVKFVLNMITGYNINRNIF